jgi:hypothetical protein
MRAAVGILTLTRQAQQLVLHTEILAEADFLRLVILLFFLKIQLLQTKYLVQKANLPLVMKWPQALKYIQPSFKIV